MKFAKLSVAFFIFTILLVIKSFVIVWSNSKKIKFEFFSNAIANESALKISNNENAGSISAISSEANNGNLEKVGTDNFNSEQIKLLQHLAKRRENLKSLEKQYSFKEKMLQAASNNIDKKMNELKSMQIKMQSLVKQYNEQEINRIKSLAKIYENMKPTDAAKIFNKLDIAFLYEIVNNMKEVKVAPILAKMDPAKAKDLSLEFMKK